MKRLLRYLQGSKNCELRLRPTSTVLVGHADADWAGNSGRSSANGHVITVGGATIGWKSVKQRTISLSSTEAEYVSCSDLAREITWLRSLMEELGYRQDLPTVICQENTGAIGWVQGQGDFKRSKHIDIRVHHIRELEKSGTTLTRFVPTHDMLADVMTKPLYGRKFKDSRVSLGIVEPNQGTKLAVLRMNSAHQHRFQSCKQARNSPNRQNMTKTDKKQTMRPQV
jgi:hypothetical protein